VTSEQRQMRILVLGDPYCPSDALRGAFEPLVPDHGVTFADVVPEDEWRPSTASELRLRETTGSPAQVERLLDDHDVLVLLAGHSLGLVGYGQVGRRVATRAKAFGMRVLAHDPYVDPATLRQAGVEPSDLLLLLAESDFVSLHARATESNRGMIGCAEIASM